jgi:hypothetical protein
LCTINILIKEKKHYKHIIKKIVLVPNTSTSLQTILAAEVNLAEGNFLLKERTLSKAKIPDIPSRNSKSQQFPKEKSRI